LHTLFTVTALLMLPLAADATEYRVGPAQPYANIGDGPWESLAPSDTVLSRLPGLLSRRAARP
jgi:hypothetical protein